VRRRILPVLLPALLAVVLTGCGGDSGGGGSASTENLPEVSGGFGAKPKITVPKGEKAGTKLQSEVLEEGDGPKVAKGDLLVADYLGQNFRSKKVFDNSYDRQVPAAFPIGAGQVIKGWDKTLVGVPAGSRVLMVVPPKQGYGEQGNPQAGIKATDSLIFVVDVIASYDKDSEIPGSDPAGDVPKGLPTVTGDPGSQPDVTVPKDAAPPTKARLVVLDKGAGDAITPGKLVVMQYTAVGWDGRPLESTWERDQPMGFPVAVPGGQPGPFDQLVGVPVGSRALLLLPPQQAGGDPKKDSVAVVVDVVAQHASAAREG
jgi:peptidylprolyl isomerase